MTPSFDEALAVRDGELTRVETERVVRLEPSAQEDRARSRDIGAGGRALSAHVASRTLAKGTVRCADSCSASQVHIDHVRYHR